MHADIVLEDGRRELLAADQNDLRFDRLKRVCPLAERESRLMSLARQPDFSSPTRHLAASVRASLALVNGISACYGISLAGRPTVLIRSCASTAHSCLHRKQNHWLSDTSWLRGLPAGRDHGGPAAHFGHLGLTAAGRTALHYYPRDQGTIHLEQLSPIQEPVQV